VEGALVLSIENLERTAARSGVDLLHPYCDPDLVDLLLRLPPEVKFAAGSSKAIVRRAYRELPPEVRDRVDKTLFNDVALAGAGRDEILAEVAVAPKRLPGIDWPGLEGCLRRSDMAFAERALVGRVLSAERFLESA
jgi:hypothetical protein